MPQDSEPLDFQVGSDDPAILPLLHEPRRLETWASVIRFLSSCQALSQVVASLRSLAKELRNPREPWAELQYEAKQLPFNSLITAHMFAGGAMLKDCWVSCNCLLLRGPHQIEVQSSSRSCTHG